MHKMYSHFAQQTCGVTFNLKLNFKTENVRVYCTIYVSRFGISADVDKVTFESRPISAHGSAVAACHTIPLFEALSVLTLRVTRIIYYVFEVEF